MSVKSDDFFSKTECDRCKCELNIRKMSWFTEEAICLNCMREEEILKQDMRNAGKDIAEYEGCGYIPVVNLL